MSLTGVKKCCEFNVCVYFLLTNRINISNTKGFVYVGSLHV